MQGDSLGKELQPGDACVHSGLYEVFHEAHRAPHRVVVSAGEIFPRCKQCGPAVRFCLVMKSGIEAVRPRARAARKPGGG
jgi:hypothetical protein